MPTQAAGRGGEHLVPSPGAAAHRQLEEELADGGGLPGGPYGAGAEARSASGRPPLRPASSQLEEEWAMGDGLPGSLTYGAEAGPASGRAPLRPASSFGGSTVVFDTLEPGSTVSSGAHTTMCAVCVRWSFLLGTWERPFLVALFVFLSQ